MKIASLLLAAIVAGCARAERPSGGVVSAPVSSNPSADTPVRDESVLVVVHSFTGRTAIAGREIAEMFGGRFLRADDGFDPSFPASSPMSALTARFEALHPKRLFVGFPIWGGAPAPPITEALSKWPLAGVEVVPFYTYLHHVDDAAVEALAAIVRARGGTWRSPIAIRASFSATREEITRRAETAVLARPELWAAERAISPRCAEEDGDVLCEVPAGPVWIGDDGSADAPPGAPPPRLEHVDAFAIDRDEVTVARYRRCESTGACKRVPMEQSFCRHLIEGHDDVPMPCVSYADARSFCASRNMRLPTEAEWTRAARAGSIAPYPWGRDAPGSLPLRGNFGEKPSTGYPDYALVDPSSSWADDGHPGLARPCSFPGGTSPFGACDLAGNLAEWVTASRGPTLKGGSWLDGEASAYRVATRGSIAVDADVKLGFYITGFRCVRPRP